MAVRIRVETRSGDDIRLAATGALTQFGEVTGDFDQVRERLCVSCARFAGSAS